MVKKEFVTLPLDAIIPYEKNPMINDDAVADTMESIKQCENLDPIEIDEKNVILSDHTRLKALKKLGYTETECVRYYGLSEDRKKKYRILANKVAEKSKWDIDLLAGELEGLDFDGFDFGFDVDLDQREEDTVEVREDKAPEAPTEPKAKLGDLWQLGNHKLICGDSTDIAVIDRLMDGVKADMVFTDPPYKLKKGGCRGKLEKRLRKQGEEIEFISNFNPEKFLNILPSLFNGNMNSYIFCNKELLPDYLNWAKDNGYSWNVLIWKKPNAIPIGNSHRPDIEYMLLFRKNAIWNNGTDANYSRCLEYSRVRKTDLNGNHPTIKPIELIANELKISSNTGSVVVDSFGGSGSTLIACEQLNRKCYMAELDPKYVSVIVNRWLNLTGRKDEIFCIRDGKKLTYDEVFDG